MKLGGCHMCSQARSLAPRQACACGGLPVRTHHDVQRPAGTWHLQRLDRHRLRRRSMILCGQRNMPAKMQVAPGKDSAVARPRRLQLSYASKAVADTVALCSTMLSAASGGVLWRNDTPQLD